MAAVQRKVPANPCPDPDDVGSHSSDPVDLVRKNLSSHCWADKNPLPLAPLVDQSLEDLGIVVKAGKRRRRLFGKKLSFYYPGWHNQLFLLLS